MGLIQSQSNYNQYLNDHKKLEKKLEKKENAIEEIGKMHSKHSFMSKDLIMVDCKKRVIKSQSMALTNHKFKKQSFNLDLAMVPESVTPTQFSTH